MESIMKGRGLGGTDEEMKGDRWKWWKCWNEIT